MTRRPKLLVDIRETATIRGFHALAALSLIAGELKGVQLYRLGGNQADERIAWQAFTFDTGLEFARYRALLGVGTDFDIYLAVANDFPVDGASLLARTASHTSIVATLFPRLQNHRAVDAVVVDGNNTRKIADALLQHLLPARGAA